MLLALALTIAAQDSGVFDGGTIWGRGQVSDGYEYIAGAFEEDTDVSGAIALSKHPHYAAINGCEAHACNQDYLYVPGQLGAHYWGRHGAFTTGNHIEKDAGFLFQIMNGHEERLIMDWRGNLDFSKDGQPRTFTFGENLTLSMGTHTFTTSGAINSWLGVFEVGPGHNFDARANGAGDVRLTTGSTQRHRLRDNGGVDSLIVDTSSPSNAILRHSETGAKLYLDNEGLTWRAPATADRPFLIDSQLNGGGQYLFAVWHGGQTGVAVQNAACVNGLVDVDPSSDSVLISPHGADCSVHVDAGAIDAHLSSLNRNGMTSGIVTVTVADDTAGHVVSFDDFNCSLTAQGGTLTLKYVGSLRRWVAVSCMDGP